MSGLKDVKSKLKYVSTILPQVATGDVTGAAVDTQDSVGVSFLASVGASGDTLSGSVKIELEVQHSDASGSGFAACADADINAAVTGTNTGTFAVIDVTGEDSKLYKVNYVGSKRYVKVIANLTGTHTNGTPLAASAVLLPTVLPAT